MRNSHLWLTGLCVVVALALPGTAWGEEGSEEVHGFTVTGDVSVDDDGNTVITGSAEFDDVEVSFEELTISPAGEVVSLGGGGFTLAGLAISITEGTTDGGELEVTAELTLPENLSGESVSTSFRLHDDVIEAVDVSVPGPVDLGLLSLSDVEVDLDFEEDAFSGGGSVEIPDLFTLTASVGVKEGYLDEISVDLQADPIVTFEVVSINEIGVSAQNLAGVADCHDVTSYGSGGVSSDGSYDGEFFEGEGDFYDGEDDLYEGEGDVYEGDGGGYEGDGGGGSEGDGGGYEGDGGGYEGDGGGSEGDGGGSEGDGGGSEGEPYKGAAFDARTAAFSPAFRQPLMLRPGLLLKDGTTSSVCAVPSPTFSGDIGLYMISEDVLEASVDVTFDETGYFCISGDMSLFTFSDIATGSLSYRPNQDFSFDFNVGKRWGSDAAYAQIDAGGSGTIGGDYFVFSAYGDVDLHFIITISASADIGISHASSGTNKIWGDLSTKVMWWTVTISFNVTNGHFSIGHKRLMEANYRDWEMGWAPLLFQKGVGYYTPELTFFTNYDLVSRAGYGGDKALLRMTKDGKQVETDTHDIASFAQDDVYLVRCGYAAGSPAAQLTLETPSGALFTRDDTPPLDSTAETVQVPIVYNETPDEGSTTFFIGMGDTDTPAGTYTITVENPDEIGAYTIEWLRQNTPPTLDFAPITTEKAVTVADTTYNIAWTAQDDDADATMTLHLTPHQNDSTGVMVGGEVRDLSTEGEAGDSIFLNDTTTTTFALSKSQAGVASGDYFVMAVLDDGHNAPVTVHGNEAIQIINPNGAPPVDNVVGTADATTAYLRWEAVEGAKAYRVYYGKDTADPAADTVLSFTSTTAVIPFLDTGVYYRFVVHAVATEGSAEGLPSDPVILQTQSLSTGPASKHDVYLEDGVRFLNNPPVIHSTPPRLVRVNDLYSYQIVAEDLDGHRLNYRLTEAPGGMTISNTGLIAWTPEEADLDYAYVSLYVAGASNEPVATQSFEIHVLGASITGTKPEIVSVPPRTPVASGEKYEYTLVANAISQIPPNGPRAAADLTWSLLVGPNGARVSADGLFTWTPPTDRAAAKSHRCVVRVEDHDGLYASQSFVIPAYAAPVKAEGEGAEEGEGEVEAEATEEGEEEGEDSAEAESEGEIKGEKKDKGLGCGSSQKHITTGHWYGDLAIMLLTLLALARAGFGKQKRAL